MADMLRRHGGRLARSCRHHLGGGRRLLHLFKKADAAALVVFRNVTFSRWPTSSSSLLFQDGQRRHLLYFFKMADVAALTACRDVIANWWKKLGLPASAQTSVIEKGPQIALELF